VVRVSKSGLGFRLSNADADADHESDLATRVKTPLTAVSPAEAKKLFARLPDIKAEPDDERDFALREKSIPPPRPGKTVTDAFPPPPGPPPASVTPPGPLTIERYAPEGPVDLAPYLNVTFSQPMVALTTMNDLAKEKPPVVLAPQPPGRWRWLGTRTVMFQPEARFPMATEYTVDVPASTRSASGQAIVNAAHWTFATPPVRLKRSYPRGRSEVTDPVLFVELDQKIEPARFLASIELRGDGRALPLRLAEPDEVEKDDNVRHIAEAAEMGRWVAFRPTEKLRTDTTFSVAIRAGAPSAEGPRVTTEEQRFEFHTFGPMRVASSSCGWSGHCRPLDALQIVFSNAIDVKRFDRKLVTVTPELPGLKIEAQYSSLVIHGRTKGRTRYEVRLGGALTDVHEQTLGTDATIPFDVGPADPALFDADKEMLVLDPASPRAYPVYTINERGLRTRVYAVAPEDYGKYLAFHREWERPGKIAPPGRLVVDTTVTPRSAPDELVSTAIDLSRALKKSPDGRLVGHALVIVEPTRAMPKGYRRPEVHVWVQATDLGLNAFVENDQATGWVTQLADGAPVAGADVQLVGAGTAKSGPDGLARLPLADKPGKLLVARRGEDSVFLPDAAFDDSGFKRHLESDEVRWFVMDDRGMYKPGEEVHLLGWVRRAGMARGGDLDSIADIGAKKVSWRVRDPRGAEIGKGEASVDAHGAFDLAFTLPGNANLGGAYVEMELEGVPLASTHTTHGFQVQEFRRPEFEVTATTSEAPHLVGRHAIATAKASYYAGGGLPNAPVTWRVTGTITGFTPPNRAAFHFGPEAPSWTGWRGRPATSMKTETWSARTDPQGAHHLRLDFDALEPSYPLAIDMTASIEDLNHQQWAARTTLLVHPASRYVGLKLARSFLRAGEPIDVDSIVTDIEGNAVAGRHVVVKSARLEWEQKGTEYVETEVDVETCELDSPTPRPGSETARCSMKAKQGGRYKVWAVVADEKGRKSQSATTLWVIGDDSPKDRGLRGGEVQLVPDQKDYVPGDTAEILVVAPFAPAEGVLRLERQGVVHLERFSMRTRTVALKVKLEEAHVPNVRAAVSLVGAETRDGPDGAPDPALKKRPAFADGRQELKVLPVSRTLEVTAAAKRTALEPGGSTQIEVEVKDSSGQGVGGAEVAIVVADEAVLALAGYKTPDPVAIFYASRAAGVRAMEMRDHVELADLDAANLRAAESWEMQAARNAYAEMARGPVLLQRLAPAPSAAAPAAASGAPQQVITLREVEIAEPEEKPIELRSNFAPLALFASKVGTDAKGRATVAIKLPDNLTRYRVMAVASGSDRDFGASESTITARLPLMVRPSAPRFLNFGDRFELPVIVQNQTDGPIDATVVARASNAVVEEAGKRVRIAPNDRAEVRFAASTVKAGTARIQIGIAAGPWADASEVELPVWTPATTEAFATYGEIDEGAMAQPVKMPPAVFPQFGGLEITTSSTQLQALTDALLYLVKYPFECNEQIASRVVSVAALRDVLQAFKTKDMPTPEALLRSVTADLAKLKRRQSYDGGWGFWQEEPWPYLSVHVAHALVRAKEKGFAPDPEMLERAHGYLRSIESHIPAWYGDDARRALIAYALYVRNRMGDPDPLRAKRLIAEAGGVPSLPIEAVGWIWPTLSGDRASTADNERIRRHIANRVTETAGAAHFVAGYKDSDWVLLRSDRRADGILLEAMIGDQPDAALIPKLVVGLLGHRQEGRWHDTQENAFVLLALDRYFHKYEGTTPDFVARVWLGDRFAGSHGYKGRTTERQAVAIPMGWLASQLRAPQNLIVGKEGPGRLYYRVGMQYAPTDLKPPPADHGFVVSRVYEGAEHPEDVKRDPDGAWRIKLGSKVRVRVTMVAPARRHHVALVDPIPAGLEAMNPALAVTGEIPKDPKSQANQTNRYWYWSRTWYEHENMRDERVEAFASLLWEGVWEYVYVARATTRGAFVVPPAKAEEMYSPETFGRSAGDRVIVEE
jgi:uncharacterized protein YfaS (alpha-2-macroglobulin family)